MRFSSSFTIGYHGCDKDVALKILNGKDKLKYSTNSWDWLGEGSYFWEHNPELALRYAINVSNGIQFANGKVKTPFVLGAIIDLAHCLDITSSFGLNVLTQGYRLLEDAHNISGVPLPKNDGDNRALDCAVIQYLHTLNSNAKAMPYDTIRGAFPEGDPIYPGTEITEKNHIQISVKNVNCIKGYFLPMPLKKYNPSL